MSQNYYEKCFIDASMSNFWTCCFHMYKFIPKVKLRNCLLMIDRESVTLPPPCMLMTPNCIKNHFAGKYLCVVFSSHAGPALHLNCLLTSKLPLPTLTGWLGLAWCYV